MNIEEKSVAKKKPRIVCNVSDTQYDVIKHVAQKKLNWLLNEDFLSEEWDLQWTDNAVSPDKLTKMSPYQKINHFPGMHGICKKNYLAWNLNRMLKMFPNDFNFFPKTWVLPGEWIDFKNNFTKNKTFILKPEALSQGRGIFLVKKIEDVNPTERCVAQEYLKNPFLIEGFKFDLRIYVLVTGCSPLRVYIHEAGLARLATETFSPPTAANLLDMCMHLTNYAINKNNSKFIFNEDPEADDIGHKRSLSAIFSFLESEGHDTQTLKFNIEDVIMKTLCSVQPYLSHLYKSCQPDEYTNSMCFELLGFDIILDSNLKPWVLEVNHSPSFTTDSPLDWKIKKTLIKDTLRLLGVKAKTRKKFLLDKKKEVIKRAITGKNCKETKEERAELAKIAQEMRDKWENNHLGGFKKLYPDGEQRFERFLNGANAIYTELTGMNICRVRKKEERKDWRPPKTAKQAQKPLVRRQRFEIQHFEDFTKMSQVSYQPEFRTLAQKTTVFEPFADRKYLFHSESPNKDYLKHKSVEIPPLHMDCIKLKKLPIKLNEYSYVPGNYIMPKTFEFTPRSRIPAGIFKESKNIQRPYKSPTIFNI